MPDVPSARPSTAGYLLLIARVLAIYGAVPLVARLSPIRLAWLLERVPLRRNPGEVRIADIRNAVARASRWWGPVIEPSCLTRSVTLFYFLRRAGIDVRLAFGAGLAGERFAAHCWLELDAEPYLEVREPRESFSTFFRVPRDRPATQPARGTT